MGSFVAMVCRGNYLLVRKLKRKFRVVVARVSAWGTQARPRRAGPTETKQVNGRLGHWLEVRVLCQPMTILVTYSRMSRLLVRSDVADRERLFRLLLLFFLLSSNYYPWSAGRLL